jgi:hypothetical protein
VAEVRPSPRTSVGMLARALVGRNSAISADPEMIGCGQSRTPLQLCAARNCSVIQSTPNGAGGRHGCWPRGLPFLVIRARPALHLAEPLGISARDDAVEPAFTMKIAQQRRDVARASAWAAQPLGNVQDARPNASAQPSTRTTRWMPILQRAANRGARAELCVSSFCGLLASPLDDGSVGFSTRRDDPSNREFSSIDNDR